MTTDEQRQSVLARLRELSPADLSILDAVIDSLASGQSVQVTTTPDSANDRLWSELATLALGWMTTDAPLDVPVENKLFTVRASAREPLAELLTDLKRDALPGIFNQLRRKMPARIAPPVIAAGGTPADVSMMLAGIIEGTMRRFIKAELHEPFLDDIVMKVRMLQKHI